MSNERELINNSDFKKLDRLLTPEESLARATELGSRDLVYKLHSSNGGEIVIYGTRHTDNIDKVRNMESLMVDSGSSIVIVEGGEPALEKARSIPLDANPHEVINKYYEEVYMAWLGLRLGKEIRSWDLSPVDWLTEISNEAFSKDEIMGWMLGTVVNLIITSESSGEKYSKDFNTIRKLMEIGFGNLEVLKKFGYEISNEKLEEICLKYYGKNLSEITIEDCERVSSPRVKNGITNDVARKITNIRDRHAIRVIQSESQENQNIFVVGGRDHIITWEPLLRNIFNK